MRLYTENSPHYIHQLAASVSKDPASLENWHCLHLPLTPLSEDVLKAMVNLREIYSAQDVDVVLCPDQDILMISRELSVEDMLEMAKELAENIRLSGMEKEVVTYDLFRDWREIRALLTAKSTAEISFESSAKNVIEMASPWDEEEMKNLHEIFLQNCNRRNEREKMLVMLVEDDPLTRRLVSNAFKDNYALINVSNAHDAITSYLLHAPDIVFLDIGLPDVSGFHVLRQIVASDPEAYVVMFSGNSYLDNINTSLESGASGFIAKPFRRDKLEHYIADSAMHHHKQAANV